MKKLLIASLLAVMSFSTFAQSIVKATKTTQDADLCFYKQVQLKGYVFANIVGRCAWDPAMNGMNLSLIAQGEDPSEAAHKIELGYIRDVSEVKESADKLDLKLVIDTFDNDGNIIQQVQNVTVRSTNVKAATFSVLKK